MKNLIKGDFRMSEKLRDVMKAQEKTYIQGMLCLHNRDKTKTAKALGISISSLYRKLVEFGIDSRQLKRERKEKRNE